MRRFLATGIWLALTVTATVIVWTAVSFVAADVTVRPAPVVARQQVVVALHAGSSPPAAPPSRPPATIAPATPPSSVAPGSPPTTASAPTTTTTVAPPTTVAPATPPTTVASAPTKKPTPVTTTTTAAPAGATAAYSTAGGVVGVECTGPNTIRLVAALPADGYQAFAFSSGPYFVAVDFVGNGRNLSVGAACVFGQPFEATQGNGPPGFPGG